MRPPVWFKEELLSTNERILGVYTALLYLLYRLRLLKRCEIARVEAEIRDFDEEFTKMLQPIRRELARFFVGRQLAEASKAAAELLELVKAWRIVRDDP